MTRKLFRLQKRVGSKARIIKPYKLEATGFSDIGLYARFPWHKTFIEPFVGGWSVILNHPAFRQGVWNTRTIPVFAVNDLNKGIIDLSFCLLYIPHHFKMSVKNAIHCQGLWNMTRDKSLLDRYRESLRMYYTLESNFLPAIESGIERNYIAECSHSNMGTSLGVIVNETRQLPKDKIKETSSEEIEDGIRQSYQNEISYGGTNTGLWVRKNQNRKPFQQLKGEDGLSNYYQPRLGFSGMMEGKNPKFVRNAPHQYFPEEPIPEKALENYYNSQHSWSSRDTSFRTLINMQSGLNEDIEEGVGAQYINRFGYGGKGIKGNFTYGINQHYDKPKDYYDEIHSRLRWIQIFNEEFGKFLKRFVGIKKKKPKTDCGFIYLDPPYLKTITGKHYEDVMTLEQHEELRDTLIEADRLGIKWLLSYDVDERVDQLYSSFKFETIQVPYSVARSYGDSRAQYDEEYLIMNYNYKEDPYQRKIDTRKQKPLEKFFNG